MKFKNPLLQNYWANFSQSWHKASLGEGGSSFFNEEPINSHKVINVLFFSLSRLWYNHMCLLIWTVFSGERCGPWASCRVLQEGGGVLMERRMFVIPSLPKGVWSYPGIWSLLPHTMCISPICSHKRCRGCPSWCPVTVCPRTLSSWSAILVEWRDVTSFIMSINSPNFSNLLKLWLAILG